MIIQQRLPGGFSIFADDVRTEDSGKLLIIGAYPNGMMVNDEPPVVLPQLTVIVILRIDPAAPRLPMVLKLIREANGENEEIARAEITLPELPFTPTPYTGPDPEPQPHGELRTTVRLAPYEITGPHLLKVRAYIGDDEVRLGTLQVHISEEALQAAGEESSEPDGSERDGL